jgi:L-malate glycosyltransferase
MAAKILQLLSRFEIGGAERAVIRLASRGLNEGMPHKLLSFDKPFRSESVDFSPGRVTTEHIQRQAGIDIRFAWKLARRLAELDVDVVHAHNDTAIFYAALAIAIGKTKGTSLIATFRNWPSHATGGARAATRWATGRAAATVAVSDELNTRLVESGWARRCRTIWNGVDLGEFSPNGDTEEWRSRLRVPENAILVGHVGRFDPIKRHADLFDAAAALQSTEPGIYFAFAGNGPLFETFRQRARALPNTVLLSNIKDVASFLRSIDIFVLCSVHEGAPQALLEAMACARAIVATRVGGIPHMIEANGPCPAGRLIPPSRPDLLAAEIMRLARDRALRDRLARAAARRAEAFSFDREWAQYAALYRAAARGRSEAANAGP